MKTPSLVPTAEGTFRIEYPGSGKGLETAFGKALEDSIKLENSGKFMESCQKRFEAVNQIMELVPDDMDVELDWNDNESRAAIMLVNFSSIDHFLVGDFELSAAMSELVLEFDPEDHLEATRRLAYSYIALGEYELFDEIIGDINDKSADKLILTMWSSFRRTGRVPETEAGYFKTRFPSYFQEFTSESHSTDPEYIVDIESERPSKEALARELWFQTEHLWSAFPDFIESLKRMG